jgi:hypothetical protein
MRDDLSLRRSRTVATGTSLVLLGTVVITITTLFAWLLMSLLGRRYTGPLSVHFSSLRKELCSSSKAKEWLQALNYENRGHVSVRTLDRFAEYAKSSKGCPSPEERGQ